MSTSWRLAESLAKLRSQINAAYPNRNKVSDGTIGDTSHAASVSDHNPDVRGVVAAFDVTHDPASGLDIAQLSQALADSRDNRIKYLIRNSQILIPANGWYWAPYSGADPHTNHLHISVNSSNYDNDRDWSIGAEPMIEGKEEHYQFANLLHQRIRGRDLPRADFAGWVGKTWLSFDEVLVYDKEADMNYENLKLGQLASRDNWRQQILDRDRWLQDLNTALDSKDGTSKQKLEAIKSIVNS